MKYISAIIFLGYVILNSTYQVKLELTITIVTIVIVVTIVAVVIIVTVVTVVTVVTIIPVVLKYLSLLLRY